MISIYMRRLGLLGLMIAVLLLGTAPMAAQCTPQFNISVYDDASASADKSTVYGYTSIEDNSIVCTCTHSGYTTVATLYGPDGSTLATTEESGFSSSVSAPTNGQSGTYQALGVGLLDCSCVGEIGQPGPPVGTAINCPETITISSTTQLPLENAFPALETGVGILATMQVAPGDLNYTEVTESVTNGTTPSCPAVIPQCSGNAVFTVGPSTIAASTPMGPQLPAQLIISFWINTLLRARKMGSGARASRPVR
jgi:hypothetical protein